MESAARYVDTDSGSVPSSTIVASCDCTGVGSWLGGGRVILVGNFRSR